MKVIVCGAGQVGYAIARQLASEHNDVTVIDHSPELIERISDALDVHALVGHASHPDVLELAGAEGADMLIAVTQVDEVNMVACQLGHSLFNVPMKIARVRAQSYLEPIWRNLFSRENMPIDVIISPEVEVARAVIRRLEAPGASDMLPFADDLVRMISVHVGRIVRSSIRPCANSRSSSRTSISAWWASSGRTRSWSLPLMIRC